MFSSFLFSKPVLCISSFIIGIALCVQIDLILTGCSFSTFAAKLFLQCATLYSKSTTGYNAPTYIANHITIDHNLCTTKFNTIASCQLVAMNAITEKVMPDFTNILQNEPETLLKLLQLDGNTKVMKKVSPFGTYYEYYDIEGIAVLLIHKSPQLTKKKLFANGVLLLLPGGGYISGTVRDKHTYMSYLYLFTGLPVLGIDYRLAPQYPLQSGALLEDADKVVMTYLHQHLSVDFNQIYLTGDSSGGGAALIWMHHFHRQGNYFGAVILVSPWCDLSIPSSLDSYVENEGMDSMLNYDAMQLFQMYALGCRDMHGRKVGDDMDECIENSLNELDAKEMNPMSADWSVWSKQTNDTTKLLFIASQYEILRDDAVFAHKKAIKNGVNSELMIVESRTHGLPYFVETPEGLELIAKISNFLNKLHEN